MLVCGCVYVGVCFVVSEPVCQFVSIAVSCTAFANVTVVMLAIVIF